MSSQHCEQLRYKDQCGYPVVVVNSSGGVDGKVSIIKEANIEALVVLSESKVYRICRFNGELLLRWEYDDVQSIYYFRKTDQTNNLALFPIYVHLRMEANFSNLVDDVLAMPFVELPYREDRSKVYHIPTKKQHLEFPFDQNDFFKFAMESQITCVGVNTNFSEVRSTKRLPVSFCGMTIDKDKIVQTFLHVKPMKILEFDNVTFRMHLPDTPEYPHQIVEMIFEGDEKIKAFSTGTPNNLTVEISESGRGRANLEGVVGFGNYTFEDLDIANFTTQYIYTTKITAYGLVKFDFYDQPPYVTLLINWITPDDVVLTFYGRELILRKTLETKSIACGHETKSKQASPQVKFQVLSYFHNVDGQAEVRPGFQLFLYIFNCIEV